MPFIGVVQGDGEAVPGLNRCKVRVYGIHPPAHDTNVPSEMLPWAHILDPTLGGGVQTNGVKAGEWVFGFFLDGRDAQFPVVVGSIPGMSIGNENNPWADRESASNVADLPHGPHMSGVDAEHTGQVPASGGVERDVQSGGGYTFSTPEPAHRVSSGTSINSKTWNGNHVVADDGHVTMHHKSGTVVQISDRGDVLLHSSAGDIWTVGGRQIDVARSGKDIVIKGGSFNIRTNGGHVNLYCEGNMNHIVRGDYNLKVSGKMNVHAGEQFEVQAAKVGLHAYTDSLNLSALNGMFVGSNTVIHMTAETDIDVDSKNGNIKVQAEEGEMHHKSKQKMMIESTDASMDVRSKEAMKLASTDNSMDIRSKEAMKLASDASTIDVQSRTTMSLQATNGQMNIKSRGSVNMQSQSGSLNTKTGININMDAGSEVYIQSGRSSEAPDAAQAAEAEEASPAEPEKPTRTKSPDTPNPAANRPDGQGLATPGASGQTNTNAFGPLEPKTAIPEEQGNPYEQTEPAGSEESGDSPSDGQSGSGGDDFGTDDADRLTDGSNIDARSQDIGARTLAGEARGSSDYDQQLIADVLHNRAEFKGTDIATEALRNNSASGKYGQFSTWNPGDPNRAYASNLSTSNAQYIRASNNLTAGAGSGISGGATHYYNPRTANPSWASKMVVTARTDSHVYGYIPGEWGN